MLVVWNTNQPCALHQEHNIPGTLKGSLAWHVVSSICISSVYKICLIGTWHPSIFPLFPQTIWFPCAALPGDNYYICTIIRPSVNIPAKKRCCGCICYCFIVIGHVTFCASELWSSGSKDFKDLRSSQRRICPTAITTLCHRHKPQYVLLKGVPELLHMLRRVDTKGHIANVWVLTGGQNHHFEPMVRRAYISHLAIGTNSYQMQ